MASLAGSQSIERESKMTEKAHIGVTGLATMGRNLARNFARRGHRVAVHNRRAERTDNLIEHFSGEGDFVPAYSLSELVQSLERPRRLVIMVKAGPPTDEVVDELAPLLDSGDILVDAGNAHFEDTRRRQAALAERGLHFVGSGVSGGEEGALEGPSIMPGGSQQAYGELEPFLSGIAADVDGTPCVAHIGPDGAGHFVKMVHNGIEYSDMQLIGEAYDLLRHAAGKEPAEIAEIRHVDHRRGEQHPGTDRQRRLHHGLTGKIHLGAGGHPGAQHLHTSEFHSRSDVGGTQSGLRGPNHFAQPAQQR